MLLATAKRSATSIADGGLSSIVAVRTYATTTSVRPANPTRAARTRGRVNHDTSACWHGGDRPSPALPVAQRHHPDTGKHPGLYRAKSSVRVVSCCFAAAVRADGTR